MRVLVKFFGGIRKIVGASEREYELKERARVSDILQILLEKFPEIEREQVLFALNHKYATLEDELKDGDEVAIFPPVNGG